MAFMTRMDLNLLAVLEMIEARGSLTRAAAELNLTQSAVSHALGRLRHHFGDPLFVRQGNAMVPTPLTLSVIGPIRGALRAMDRSVNEARRFDPAESERRFTIGLQQGSELGFLRTMAPAVAALAPAIGLSFVRLYRKGLETELATGKLDIAVDVPLALPERVKRRRIASDTLVVVVSANHPLVRGSINEATYRAADHVLVSARRRGGALEDQAIERMGWRRKIGLRCQNLHAACEVVADSALLLTVAISSARTLAPQFGLQILPAPISLPPIELYAYWHALAEGDAAHNWLRTQLFAAFEARERAAREPRSGLTAAPR
jgi:DNA-binding transcriptional LysR family regulator